tara:strand:- start:55 stop:444 length:390 start_codon:yes stop_codon:yes gene_type:complete
MKEVYLYFRTQGTLADDDAAGDSAMYPLSKLRGMVPSADDTLNIYFDPMIPVQHDDQNGSVINADYVVCSIGANDHKDAIAALTRLFAGAANGGIHHDGYISVADDYAGTYAVSEVTGLSTISTATAVS